MIINKIVHCADLHLGAKNIKLPLDKQKILSQEHLEGLKEIFLSQSDIVLICGDLFHSKTVTRKIMTFFFNLVKNYQKPVLYVSGNHDEKFDFSLVPSNFIVLNRQNAVFKTENVDFWCKEGDFSLIDKNKKNILLLHGEIKNKLDNDYVDINEFTNLPFDYIALGHEHSFSLKEFAGKVVVYSGAAFANGFDECGQKGFVSIDVTKDLDIKFLPILQREFKIMHFDISPFQNLNQIKLRLMQIMSEEKNNLVRIIFEGYYEEGYKPDFKIIDFSNFYCEYIDNTKLKLDFQKYKNEQLSFKAEFIKLVEESNLDENMKNQILTLGLEALQGDELSI